MNSERRIKTWTWYTLASIALWAGALVLGAVCFVGASEAARSSPNDGTFLHDVLGAPMFEGFRHNGKFGVHPQWGLVLLVVIPLCATILITGLQVRRFVKGDRA